MWYFRWFRTISRALNSICPQVFWKFLLGHFKFDFFDFCSSHWLNFWFHKILSFSFCKFFSNDQFGTLFGAQSYFEFWTVWKVSWKLTWINLRSSRLLNSNWGLKWVPKFNFFEKYVMPSFTGTKNQNHISHGCDLNVNQIIILENVVFSMISNDL